MNNIKANYFLCGCFTYAICYQLFVGNISYNNNDSKLINDSSIISEVLISEKNVQSLNNVNHLIKPDSYKLSENGKKFIKQHETCILKAYNDPDPKRRSVGWGHQIQPGENLEKITQKKADELFDKDIELVNKAINRLIAQNDDRFVYSQGFIDGLGSLIYNCGERGVTLTEFWNRWQKCRYDKNTPGYINKNDLNYAIAAVKTSGISAPGHIDRRYKEHLLMLN